MALKRLDEEFELKPGTQLLPYMKRLLPSLEARFQDLEEVDRMLKGVADDIRAAALLRMNEILIPATEDIIAVTKLGFLLGPITDVLYEMKIGFMGVYIDEGPQRDTFTPSPYLIVEGIDDKNNYCIAKLISYDQELGILEMDVTAIHGDPSAQPWMVTSTPGMAHSTKDYHDAIEPMHATVVTDTAEVVLLHEEIMAAAQALADSGLDAYAFIRRDGTVPFEALQTGFAPPNNANNDYIPTTAWVRSRIQEYVAPALMKSGGTMSGPLILNQYPTQPMQAATKDYVDSAFGAGGTMLGSLTIKASNPSLSLYPNSIGQDRIVWGLGANGTSRWALDLGNIDQESGGSSGSNFALYRYGDMGEWLGSALTINRANGHANFGTGITANSHSVVNGNLNVNGDLYTLRGDGTGVLFMGSGYHYWNGGTHIFTGGGGSFEGPVSTHALNTHAISTQGHYLTSWGLTSHGNSEVNGQLLVRGQIVMEGGAANYIRFYDNNWGNMYIHNNDGLIGFLGHDGGWRMYVNNSGQVWCGALGWVHDYVNSQANWYAWNAADARYNQLVSSVRWAYVGDLGTNWNNGGLGEPYGGSAITGFAGYNGYNMYVTVFRFRQLQYCVAGGWYASWYA
jgi:hypothetical protein